jgi:hypothetical protein
VLVLTLVCSAILAGLVVYFFPRKETPPFQVVAWDGIYTPEETPVARGQLLPPNDDEPAPRLSGHTIVFDDQQNRTVIVTSDDKGQGETEWKIDDGQVSAFFVRFIDRGRKQGSATESGRLYVWPKDARILLLDADETLHTDDLDEKAVAFLEQAHEDGWRIVYLSLGSTTAQGFRQARGRLDEQAKLPKGPILGRPSYPSAEPIDAARRTVLQPLKSKFTGSTVAIVKTAEAADTCKSLGFRVIRIGDAATPTWAEISLK